MYRDIIHEVSTITCYKRSSTKKESYQRRILLKSNGQLKGCSSNKPLPVAIMELETFQRLKDDLNKLSGMNRLESENLELKKEKELLKRENHDLKTHQTSINDKLTLYQTDKETKENMIDNLNKELVSLNNTIQDLKSDNEALFTKYDNQIRSYMELQRDFQKSTNYIAIAWTMIREVQSKNKIVKFIAGITKLDRIKKPSTKLLPSLEDPPIND